MPTIVVCSSHQAQGYPPTIEGTPTAFDIVDCLSADLAVEIPQPGGVPRTHLDCLEGCRWSSDPTPGQIEEYPELAPKRSVGDPNERPTLGQIREHNKQRNGKRRFTMATVIKPQKRERKRGTVITRKFSESVTATFAVSGTLTDYLMLSDEAQADLAALVEKMGTPSSAKIETPKGA